MALATRADRLRFALLVGLLGALVCDPALAADSLRQSGVVIDKRPVVDDANWSISESSATWDTQSFTGKYRWSIPSSIPADGANASLTVTSTDKSGGRYNGVISATADMTIEGTARAEALADKNGGQATVSDTANFRLLPGSYCDTCTPSVTVFVQDGPEITFQYKVAAPPCSVAALFSADAAADTRSCNLGKLPVGKRITVDTPEPGKTKDISPREIPPETYRLILEILAEQEHERLVAGLAAQFKSELEARRTASLCFLFGRSGFETERDGYRFLEGPSALALYTACAKLLLEGSRSTPAGARAAASGCNVVAVPLFAKGTKVTKKRRTRAVAAVKDRVRASCDGKRNGMAISLKARGKGATLNRVTGKDIGAPLARLSDTPANGRRVSVRWRARKR